MCPNLPKYLIDDDIVLQVFIFRQWHPFFLTQLSFLLKNSSMDLLDIKSHKNCLALPRWCFIENCDWFWPSVLQWRHILRENFNSFLRGPKNGELWQAITSSKLNIFWCSFFSFRFLKEILFRKLKKRVNFGDCLPLKILGKNLDHYAPLYDSFILLGDFNSETTEEVMEEFCNLYNLIKSYHIEVIETFFNLTSEII